MADQAARLRQEDAQAQAAEIVAQARAREERLARETERMLREHVERREELKAHLEHVRGSLAALTGKPVRRTPLRPASAAGAPRDLRPPVPGLSG